MLENIKKKTLIAGSIKEDILKKAIKQNVKVIDIMEKEELAVLNTIATAEGAIEQMISNTDTILQGSKVLILGFGRVGKIFAKKLDDLSVEVTCAVRKKEDMAWIKAYGYKAIDINTLGENLSKYDSIVNTVPNLILDKTRLQFVNKDCLLMDLASKPGGMDEEEIRRKNLKFVWALALPGKVAPTTTAEFIKDTIFNVLV